MGYQFDLSKVKDSNKHINKEIDSSFVVVEYIQFLSNLSK